MTGKRRILNFEEISIKGETKYGITTISRQHRNITEKIQEAEVIVVGGAAGMTEAAGYSSYQSDANFLKYFGKFADKYDIKNIFEGFYYPFSSKEERWAFLATDIKFIYDAKPSGPYLDLL